MILLGLALLTFRASAEPAPEPAQPAGTWTLQTPKGPGQVVDPSRWVAPGDPPSPPQTDAQALARQAEGLLSWRQRYPDAPETQSALLGRVPGEAINATLAWLSEVVAQDSVTGQDRLSQPGFLEEHACYLRWTPDAAAARQRGLRLGEGLIRLTEYLVWQVEGRASAQAPFDSALYGVPREEAGLSEADADALPNKVRERFTRREVLDGAYLPGGLAPDAAPPLVWLKREDVHEALMQGTIQVQVPGSPPRLFNVHRHNGRAYQPGKRGEDQEKLWYFREVDGIYGWGQGDKVPLQAGVAVAGDIPNLGLGALIQLSWEGGGQLVLLADTGGAFQPNLFQLDHLVGAFPTRSAFQAEAARTPEQVQAGFWVLRASLPAGLCPPAGG